MSVLASTSSAATLLGPSPYLSFADSPFSGQTFSYFYLETFESGTLQTPGVSFTPGALILGPSSLTDSVDADDGAIDGSGMRGHSLLSNGAGTIVFTFNAAALGGLPTSVGIVWTDVGNATPTLGVGPVTFQAFDAASNSLGTIGPVVLGDGNAAGGTAEDRFFGVVNPGGISSIAIGMSNSVDWEVDHLQYGFEAESVPEPASWMLAMCGLGGFLLNRSKIRK